MEVNDDSAQFFSFLEFDDEELDRLTSWKCGEISNQMCNNSEWLSGSSFNSWKTNCNGISFKKWIKINCSVAELSSKTICKLLLMGRAQVKRIKICLTAFKLFPT